MNFFERSIVGSHDSAFFCKAEFRISIRQALLIGVQSGHRWNVTTTSENVMRI